MENEGKRGMRENKSYIRKCRERRLLIHSWCYLFIYHQPNTIPERHCTNINPVSRSEPDRGKYVTHSVTENTRNTIKINKIKINNYQKLSITILMSVFLMHGSYYEVLSPKFKENIFSTNNNKPHREQNYYWTWISMKRTPHILMFTSGICISKLFLLINNSADHCHKLPRKTEKCTNILKHTQPTHKTIFYGSQDNDVRNAAVKDFV
jgi:hypothetical protein